MGAIRCYDGKILCVDGKIACDPLCCCDDAGDCCPEGQSATGGTIWIDHDCGGGTTSINNTGGQYGPWIVSCADNWEITFKIICVGSGVCDYRLQVSGELVTADPDCFDLVIDLTLSPIAGECKDLPTGGNLWFPGFTIPECPTGTCCTVTQVRAGATDPGTTIPGSATTC